MAVKVTIKNEAEAKEKIRRVVRHAYESVRSLANRHVTVGIKEGAKYPNGKYVRDVAALVEYGTFRMPPRPYMRACRAENKGKWHNQLRRELRLVIKGEQTADQALQKVGATMLADIRATIEYYGAIDTGRLRDSYEIQIT